MSKKMRMVGSYYITGGWEYHSITTSQLTEERQDLFHHNVGSHGTVPVSTAFLSESQVADGTNSTIKTGANRNWALGCFGTM